MRRVAILFARFGPYHLARLQAAAERLRAGGGDVVAVQVANSDGTYAWRPVTAPDGLRCVTCFASERYDDLPPRLIGQRVRHTLAEIKPDVVVLPGWGCPEALAALAWATAARKPAVVMSESARIDAARRPWTEAVKRSIVRAFDAALVGGRRHADYLADLGMPPDRISLGYDVVDNAHFAAGADAARQQAAHWRAALRLPERYFYASSRFVEKKNLPGLLRAFAQYRRRAGSPAWNLVLSGDGPLRPALEAEVEALGLHASVHLTGFLQYESLPAYYGLASAFVHASTVEQWGLVINEAAASGLPLLVSDRCGAVTELLEEGRNGCAFDPAREDLLAERMYELSADPARAAAMGQASREIVAAFGPARFGDGLAAAVDVAATRPRRAATAVDRLLLHWMATR